MKRLLFVLGVFLSLSLIVQGTEARRLGGGRNLGMQRSAPTQQQAAPKAPAEGRQQQAAPVAPAQQPSPASKWLGPLAGLALGVGLAALFLNNGWAGLLAGLLLISLIVVVVLYAARALRGRLVQQPLQYAGTARVEPVLTALSGGAGAQSLAAVIGRWPASFNADDFVRHARLNFVRLQDAHDKQDFSMMREFLMPEVYREIEADIRSAGSAQEKTEVLTLEAEVLDVAEEADSYVVSVRFSGMIRETPDGKAEPFSEIWHLQKSLTGRSGWVVAGIQQA
jgi:predicted lipid-binding transport protein (Tim44 family)